MAASDAQRWGRADVGAGALLLALGIIILAAAPTIEETHTTDPVGPRFLPRLLAVVLILLSLWLMVDGAQQARGRKVRVGGLPADDAREKSADAEGLPAPARSGGGKRVLLVIGVMGLYVSLLEVLGYILASVLFFCCLLWIAGQHRPLVLIAQAAGVTVVLYILFGVVLGVHLPEGLVSPSQLRR